METEKKSRVKEKEPTKPNKKPQKKRGCGCVQNCVCFAWFYSLQILHYEKE
jgi:hypothetical protein